ncbi:hypothetical protein CLV48_102108 [Cecembia rubra]|uniref:Uncharacterized protein n=1 Tax=Cecembia rubra TaxID=1485585 RepID=A0A2P8E9Z1_9BACT|nr:hypothetical protein CLV48_102108 [Cecembia rubra]
MVCGGFKKVWMGVFAVMIRSLGFVRCSGFIILNLDTMDLKSI